MKYVQAFEPQLTYQASGGVLEIYWDEHEIVRPSDNGEEHYFVYRFCEVSVTASRSQIIEAIIATDYTTGGEFAVINNRDVNPDAYEAYQAFRATAKALADGWVNR